MEREHYTKLRLFREQAGLSGTGEPDEELQKLKREIKTKSLAARTKATTATAGAAAAYAPDAGSGASRVATPRDTETADPQRGTNPAQRGGSLSEGNSVGEAGQLVPATASQPAPTIAKIAQTEAAQNEVEAPETVPAKKAGQADQEKGKKAHPQAPKQPTSNTGPAKRKNSQNRSTKAKKTAPEGQRRAHATTEPHSHNQCAHVEWT